MFRLLLCLLTLQAVAPVWSHGVMNQPNQRGCLAARPPYIMNEIDADAPTDYYAHFPAGSKSTAPGSGMNSQYLAAGRVGWTPFKPLSPSFRWRSSVCGDAKWGPYDHVKGGKYYHNGTIVRTYRQASVISVGMSVNAHHNGFIELHICDASRCPGGDISAECFRQGHCKQLHRAWDARCESRTSSLCGPIDWAYPGRWYFPCSRYGLHSRERVEYFGGKQHADSVKYRLPPSFMCEHCVLQWFWTAANSCNPPGVREYFEGPDRPHWGNCRGQGGAVGGFARSQPLCGDAQFKRFPEEYLQCADVRIVPAVDAEKERARGFKAIRALVLVVDGVRLRVLRRRRNYINAVDFNWATIEALVADDVQIVVFTKNGVFNETTVAHGPRFFPSGPKARPWLPFNEWVDVKVGAPGDTDRVRIYLRKRSLRN